MSIFKSVKRAFGFSGNEYNEEAEDEVLEVSSSERTPYINPFKKENEQEAKHVQVKYTTTQIPLVDSVKEKKSDEIMLPDAALSGLISMINSTLPEYVRNCIDPAAQKKYICDSMGESFKSFAAEIKDKALAEERSQWATVKENSLNKIKELTASIQEYKSKNEESHNQFLSVERQKRALSERIRELEGSIAKLEAESEQYELENKSLLNKLKVEQVKTDDVEYFKKENDRIVLELNKFKALALKSSEFEKEIAESTEKLAAVEAEKAELQQLVAEKESTVSDMKIELDMTVEMVNALRKEASAAKAELNEIKSQPAQEIPVVDESELAELKEKLKIASSEIASLQEELQEANTNLEVVGEIQEQLEKVDELKKRKDEKIEALTESMKQRDFDNASLRSEVEFLKSNSHYKEKEYSRKLKELAALYESELAKQKEELKPKKKEDDAIDMTELEDALPSTMQPVAPVAQEMAEDTIEYESTPITPEIEESDIFEIEQKEEETEEKLFFSAEDAVSTTPKISAIDSHDHDWLQPSPPSAPIAEPVSMVNEEPKQPKKEEDTLQMSLF